MYSSIHSNVIHLLIDRHIESPCNSSHIPIIEYDVDSSHTLGFFSFFLVLVLVFFLGGVGKRGHQPYIGCCCLVVNVQIQVYACLSAFVVVLWPSITASKCEDVGYGFSSRNVMQVGISLG